jgi:hypothetical protein
MIHSFHWEIRINSYKQEKEERVGKKAKCEDCAKKEVTGGPFIC